MDKKKSFIKELGSLLKKYNVAGVSELKYETDRKGEYLVIKYEGCYELTIDITRNSILQILKDLSRWLGR
jgi:hypothetical protein